MVAIVGEITASRKDIILMAGGVSAVEAAGAAKRLKLLTPLIKKSDPPGALVLPATWAAVVQLSHMFGTDWHPQPALVAWTAEQVKARTSMPDLVYKPPEGLTPYLHQRTGAALIAATGHMLITDEQGVGKTITTILGLAEIGANSTERPRVVVVCPASVVDHWVRSFNTWLPSWKAVAWRGTPAKRADLTGTADVYVTSYETARKDAPEAGKGPLCKLKPTAVVLDECQRLKNHDAQQTKAVARVAKTATVAVALSGTPIAHTAADLWPTLAILFPGAWPSRERWVERYCLTISGEYKDEILGLHPNTEPEFRMTLLGQHRRVTKADVLDLPPKIYSVRTVELPPEWRKVYDDFEADMLAELPAEGGEGHMEYDSETGAGRWVEPVGQELSVMDTLAQLGHLSRLASSAADVEITTELNKEGDEVEHVHLELKMPSWKIDALLEILDERPDQSVSVWSPSRQLTMLAGKAAEKAGRRVGYIVGGQSQKERTRVVDAFQSGELDTVCATTGAGGVGLTLTAASTVVFLQRPWSLVDALQTEDRHHRVGSEIHDCIEIIDIVAHDTIDSRIRGVLHDKAGQLGELVQDPAIVAELLGGKGLIRKKAS